MTPTRPLLTAALTALLLAHATPAHAMPPAGPRLYLPLVQHLPRMSAEYTPAPPIATPEPPEPPVSGDVQ